MRYILIASRPRCGTHFLKTKLGTCDNAFYIPEEAFNNESRGLPGFWDGESDPSEWVRNQYCYGKDLCAFVSHPGHLESDERVIPSVGKIITEVIVLYRRDILAQYISNSLAYINNDYDSSIQSQDTFGTIKVDKNHFIKWFYDYIYPSIITDIERWCGFDRKFLAYEDISNRFGRVASWLSLDPKTSKTETSKKEKRNLSDVVLNYQEARSWSLDMLINESIIGMHDA